jgi:hypothetical protein
MGFTRITHLNGGVINGQEYVAENTMFAELYEKLEGALTVGTGFVGTGGSYNSAVYKVGNLFKTEIVIDLTGAKSSTTDLDIIGTHATDPASIGLITDAVNGLILAGRMTCLELPVGGITDIDLYRGSVGTGKFDDPSSGLTGAAALVTAGGAWTNGMVKGLIAVPADASYLYLLGGAAGTAQTYSAGKFLIELWGE